MARKEKTVLIEDGTPETNRDFGKAFHIREMAASKAERWAIRALLAVARSGVDIDDSFMGGGMQSIAYVGLQAIMRVQFEDVEDLLDELMECITIVPDPSKPKLMRDLMEDDIEEVKTRIMLRKEVIELHMGFFRGANPSTPESKGSSESKSSNTPISQDPSVRFSRKN